MSLDLGELALRLSVHAQDYDRGLDAAESRASGFSSKLVTYGKYGAAAIGTIGTAAAFLGVKTAASNEQAQISFETMLGSAEKAGAFLRDLQSFAASTPFEFPELQRAASSLISAGIEADKVIPIMTTLGDVTSGMGTGSEGVQRATIALQQMSAAGRITGEDLNQLRDAGVPVYDLLAKATGKSKEEVVALAQAGKLGKKELGQMMSALESGKGLERFSGLMEKQSHSLTGMWSTLLDTVGQGTARAIEPLLPLMKDGLGGAAVALGGAFAILGGGASHLASAIIVTAAVIRSIAGFVRSNQTTFTVLAAIIGTLLLPAFVAWGVQATIAAVKNAAAWLTSKAAAASSAALQVAALTYIALRWAYLGAQAMLGAGRQVAALTYIALRWAYLGAQAMLGAGRQVAAWVLSKAGAAGTVALYGVAFAFMAAGWIASGIAATAGAIAMAAAWLLAIWPIALVVAAVAGVVFLIIKYWDQIKAATAAAWHWVAGAVVGAGHKVAAAVGAIVGFVKAHWPLLLAIISGPIGLAVLFVVRNMNRIKAFMSATWSAIRGAARAAWNGVVSIVSAGANAIVSFVRGIPGKLRAMASNWAAAGRALINAFVNGLKNAGGIISGIAGNVWNAVKSLLNGAISRVNAALNFTINIPGPDIHINAGQIPHLAEGGVAFGPTLAVVGDGAGPELIQPLNSSKAKQAQAAAFGNGGGPGGPVELSAQDRELMRRMTEEFARLADRDIQLNVDDRQAGLLYQAGEKRKGR